MHANNDNHAYIVLRCIIVVLLLINPYYKKERYNVYYILPATKNTTVSYTVIKFTTTYCASVYLRLPEHKNYDII
jgi:hypothetical protein